MSAFMDGKSIQPTVDASCSAGVLHHQLPLGTSHPSQISRNKTLLSTSLEADLRLSEESSFRTQLGPGLMVGNGEATPIGPHFRVTRAPTNLITTMEEKMCLKLTGQEGGLGMTHRLRLDWPMSVSTLI